MMVYVFASFTMLQDPTDVTFRSNQSMRRTILGKHSKASRFSSIRLVKSIWPLE
jgi:hypothetical protein